MLKSGSPPRFPIAFASSAGGSFIRPIPQASQIGIVNGAASLTDGFPPLNFQPVAAGGVPPYGEDFNGILNQISLWCQWFEAGAPIYYDATFATTGSGGYPQGTVVQSNISPGAYWMSTADNNTTDPDSLSSANWIPDPSRIASGTPVASFSSTVPAGYVAANALTIGNASSNATGRANGDTLLAYRAIWQQFSNTACPIFTSAGVPSTRGSGPDADFAANKALSTPDMKGTGIIGVDTMGGSATTRLAGVPITTGNATTPGSVLGENLHALVLAENGPHGHGITDPGHVHNIPYGMSAVGNINTSAPQGGPQYLILTVNNPNTAGASTGITINTSGSGTGHNTVERNTTVFWNIKL